MARFHQHHAWLCVGVNVVEPKYLLCFLFTVEMLIIVFISETNVIFRTNFFAIFLCSFSFCFQMLAISEGQMPLSWPEEGMTYTTMTTTTSTTEKWIIESEEEESKESEEENEEKVNISLIIFFLQSIIFKCWF